MSDFVHLHTHSEFSLLDGLTKIPELVKKAKDLGMSALALTDHGAMYGAFAFYKAAKKVGIKPIIGVEAYQARKSRFDKSPASGKDRFHLVLLAKNLTGYRNLLKLTTIAHLEGYYYKPRIDFEVLEKHHEGLICLSGCLQGMVPSLIRDNQLAEAEKTIRRFQALFGEDYYLELQKHEGVEALTKVNEQLVHFSRSLGVPLVATNDVHYLEKDDAYAQEILLCIQTQRVILEKNRPLSMYSSPSFYLRSGDEMASLFPEYPEAIVNTLKIAEKCNLEIETGNWILPKFVTPAGQSAKEYLKEQAYKRFKNRYPEMTPAIKKRLDYELEVISKKRYDDYFLIVADFVNWAKRQGIAVGPGRGSSAGCIVGYILEITDVDPLLHNIPFERFLNPDRPSPPDFDLDFADDRRDEVIAYVTEKYGERRVAQIITFGTMEARGAIRDAGRALGMPYSQPDRIARMIPVGKQGFAMTLEKALEVSPELANAYQSEEETRKLVDLAKKLEGVSRHSSTHAAGLVIADRDLDEYVPLQREVKSDRIITQYDMYSLDLNAVSDNFAVGLLKMDFLGLRNLSILEKAIGFVKTTQGKSIDLKKIPLDDKKTYELITSGETTGVFQLESGGMRRLGRNLKPSKFSDIAAMVALFRPGPMEWIDDFITAKNNPQRIHYLHPDLQPVLGETYGIAVYQEQCMQIANVMAGYTMVEADRLRLAIGKKKPELMEKEKKMFLAGCLKQGYSKDLAKNLFSQIEKFVGYGFNKAHAASYAMIAYWTAYMKSHYPVEFMTALLTAETRGTSGPLREEKLRRAVEECRRMAITILPPDINKSGTEFGIEALAGKPAIRFGLSAVKNVGSAAIETILEGRQKSEFLTLKDFCQRVDLRRVNKKTLESLIKVGAMDHFGKRASLLAGFPDVVGQAQKGKQAHDSGQELLFQTASVKSADKLPDLEEFSKKELLALEREFLGFYLSEHPLKDKLQEFADKTSHNIHRVNEATKGTQVRFIGVVTRIKKVNTRANNNEMIFASLEDLDSSVDCVVFPKTYAETKDLWFVDSILWINGKVDRREDKINVLVERVRSLDR